MTIMITILYNVSILIIHGSGRSPNKSMFFSLAKFLYGSKCEIVSFKTDTSHSGSSEKEYRDGLKKKDK